MQCSVHTPSQFITRHQATLLPSWSRPVASVLVVLQPCTCELLSQTPSTELQKHQLRAQFLTFGSTIAHHLEQLGHLAEVFDPRSGAPSRSQPGALPLDDVAVVKACLGYPAIVHSECWAIVHPAWGSAVYPSTLLSSAAPAVVQAVCDRVLGQEG
jgi:Methylmalonic aciduria and homocystinuria type D protein